MAPLCAGVSLLAEGFSKVKWSETYDDTKKTFRNAEQYFTDYVYLLGSGNYPPTLPFTVNTVGSFGFWLAVFQTFVFGVKARAKFTGLRLSAGASTRGSFTSGRRRSTSTRLASFTAQVRPELANHTADSFILSALIKMK